MIHYRCDHCGARYKAPDHYATRAYPCRRCGKRIQVPRLDRSQQISPQPVLPAAGRAGPAPDEDFPGGLELVPVPPDEPSTTRKPRPGWVKVVLALVLVGLGAMIGGAINEACREPVYQPVPERRQPEVREIQFQFNIERRPSEPVAAPRPQVCSYCDGTGRGMGWCRDCNGSGWMRRTDPVLLSRCLICGGSGFKVCSHCWGSGVTRP